MLTLDDFRESVAAGTVDSIVVASADIQGKLFGKRLPADYFLERSMGGIHVPSSMLTYDNEYAFGEGFPEIGSQNAWNDMTMVPDLKTLRFYGHKPRTAVVLCDAKWANGDRVEYLPRQILKNQIDRLAEAGLAMMAAAETEFLLFREEYESAAAKNWANLVRSDEMMADYNVMQSDIDEIFLGDVRRALIASGIPVDAVKHEWGKGQHEITLTYSDAMAAADRITLFKTIVKGMAQEAGLSATFMARYSRQDSGSSGHMHSSLWDLELQRNLLCDSDSDYPGGLSSTGRHWLGGMMANAPGMMPLYCPGVNSYKRLDAATFGPSTLAWGIDVRTVPFRLCSSGSSAHIENRIPGADANFYLAMAAMIASGLHGIENGTDPIGEPAMTSVHTPGERLPITLRDALPMFRDSEVAHAAFGSKVVEHIAVAAEHELSVYEREVSDIERRRYFQWA
ncbi:hypothetical protein A5727_16900 [Mycobacterium sp. ACS4331]|nr:hypothetical protein A5727_16900 [Mycobacterium sp. ACS4331]